jgi:hypothetical protein
VKTLNNKLLDMNENMVQRKSCGGSTVVVVKFDAEEELWRKYGRGGEIRWWAIFHPEERRQREKELHEQTKQIS